MDSCTNFKLYVDKAKELGQTAIAFTEHGNVYNWVEKKMYCDKQGIKYMHGVEAYLTEKHIHTKTEFVKDDEGNVIDSEEKEFKIRDNFHTVLIAKNEEGVRELNEILSIASTEDDHFYYKPRISFDEFLGLSSNIIKISACLASPLNKLPIDHPYYEKLARHYDYYEIQPHVVQDQVNYNRHLYMLAQQYNKPLIAGTDTHNQDSYKAECRSVLQLSKRVEYSGEDEFDLTYKSYDELVQMFKMQDALPESVYLEAIENTNVVADSVEPFELDVSFKYPKLYDDDEAKFRELVEEKFNAKVEQGIIPKEQVEDFIAAIKEEDRVFGVIDMRGFMLSMAEFVSWCKENDIPVGFNRGSCGGSRIAYITDITDLNPEEWKTVFSRFCNEDRKEIGDIDIDVAPEDRERVYDYIIGRFGQRLTAFILALGTITEKGTIDEIGRGLSRRWEKENFKPDQEIKEYRKELRAKIDAEKDKEVIATLRDELSDIDLKIKEIKDYNDELKKDNPYSLKIIARIKKEFEADEEGTREKYPDIFYYYDGLLNTVTSQSMHPAGIVVSPITLADNYGVFKREGHVILSIDMECIHEVSLVKYDILGLKNIGIIKDAYKLIGKPYPLSHEIDWYDEAVWEDMLRSPIGIFQFEGEFAHSMLKQFRPRSIFEMSHVNAAIRPSGASYRDRLFKRELNKNPSKIIDDLFADNLGYLIYQEDTIKFLQDICGMSGSDADNTRRAIGRKDKERLMKALPQILEGYCSNSPQARKKAEEEAKEFLQIIEDSAEYQFGYNHSVGYCMIGYLCAYLRYYYPYEFITAYLNNAKGQDDISSGSDLAREYKIKMSPVRFRYSQSNYNFDCETQTIYKGMASIKFLNKKASDQLYKLRDREYDSFMTLLTDITNETSLNSRQLEILIKIGFFSEFGNGRELLMVRDMFDLFKQGQAKQIAKHKVYEELDEAIQPFVDGDRKDGTPSKSYTILDMRGVLCTTEDVILARNMEDFSYKEKMEFQNEYLGYIDMTTNKLADRKKLFVTDLFPLKSQKTGKPWGYAAHTKSLGTGKIGRLTIRANLFDRNPFKKGSIVFADAISKNNAGYWYLDRYKIIS